jgi:D-sedoheptulose 7-phosphate isomerase
MKQEIDRAIAESVRVKKALSQDEIESAARLLIKCIESGNKVLLCGNGGSAADCQHMAGELVGRFRKERKAYPAISLATDTSILTALANDYGGEIMFARQVEALGGKGDVLIAFSTSGVSPNILRACAAAKREGMKVIGFTGSGGQKLKKLSDVCVMVPSRETPRIQEAHIMAVHIICGLVEESIS